MKYFLRLLGIVCLFLFMSANAVFGNDSSGELAILRVTPSGDDVPVGREIAIQFNRAVVPVGRMERSAEELGISIEPKLDCQWRWLNTSTLACQLGEKTQMEASTRYELRVAPKIVSFDGKTLASESRHVFITARPQLTYAWLNMWLSPVLPQFYVSFNQPVTESSIEDHVYIVDDSGKRYGLVAEKAQYSKGDRWLVKPRNELPADTSMTLSVEAGINGENGNQGGVQAKEAFAFATFGDFKFIGVKCYPNLKRRVEKSVFNESYYEDEEGGEQPEADAVEILAGQLSSSTALCNPTAAVSLIFSVPVIKEDIKDGLQIAPDLKGGREDFDPWEDVYSYAEKSASHKKGDSYELQLPTPLRALQTYQIKAKAESLKDIFGRTNQSPVDISFLSDHRPAKFHLGNQVSILEKDTDSHLPLIVTNLDSLNIKYEKISAGSHQLNQKQSYSLYNVKDIAYPYPLAIREMLAGKSGAVQGIIEAATNRVKGDAWFFSQVTPYHVHVKVGHYNSLVWVTNFSDGQPIPGATVSFYSGELNNLKNQNYIGRKAITDKNGLAVLDGTTVVDPTLTLINNWRRGDAGLFVKVEKDDELALLPASNDFSVYAETAYPYTRKPYAHMKVWGTTAQGVYKLGDTIQYKILLRDQDLNGFVEPPSSSYKLTVIDPTGKTVFEKSDLQLSDFGALDGELEISKNWAVGWYQFQIKPSFSDETWDALRVLVSDFTPAPFRVTTDVRGKQLSIGDNAEVNSEARLHAGGPFADAQIRVTAHVSNRDFKFSDQRLDGFEFNSGDDYSEKQLYEVEGQLDSKGDYHSSFKLEESEIIHGLLLFESAVSDDRGKRVANTKAVEYFGRDRFVGLKQTDWILEKDKPASVEIVVVDSLGNLIPGVKAEVAVKYEETKAAKVKGPGNAYVTQYTTEWISYPGCQLVSASNSVTCNFTPQQTGLYELSAAITDSAGRVHTSKISRWAGGSGYTLWKADAGSSLNIIPEKPAYSIGETARYLVQNPFPGAKALITVERYGVLQSWTKELENSAEIIEVPVRAEYLPGFYLSVVVTSPRVDKPIENQVDLGKPAFRMGYAQTEVVDNVKQLEVKVKPERELYKPRERVTVDFQVVNKEKAQPTEIAVAVLDEAVFDLIAGGKDYFDPFKGLYSLDTLDVRNFNIIKQLVGRQKFEKKGANPGGSGGSDLDMRSIFKFVSYWNPALKTDSDGKARVSFDVPDNLTGWRVLALAATKTDQVGLGEANFKVNQSIEIRPALPNQIVESDSFNAAFTLLNRSDKTKTIDVSMQATGALLEPQQAAQKITVEPFKRQIVSFPLSASRDGEIAISVQANDGVDRDALQAKLLVNKKMALETSATYGTTTDEAVKEKFALPSNLREDVGFIAALISPSVIAGLDESFKYLMSYPYSCWEQKLTKGVMADHYGRLKPYLAKDFSWNSAEEVVNSTLKSAESFQAPNGGMTFYVPQDQYVSPYLSAYTAIAFHWLKSRGRQVPQALEEKLDGYLLELLRKNTMPDFYSKAMASTVRAVALAALAQKGKAKLEDLNRYMPFAAEMDLFGKAHMLMAAASIPSTQAAQKRLTDMIMSSANESGGKFVFSESLDGVWQRVMASIPRSQCAILSALLASKKAVGSASYISDDVFFKIVRSISQYRKIQGRWENTQENIFCMNALIEYSQAFEKTKPNYSFEVKFDGEDIGGGKQSDVKDAPQEIKRALKAGDAGKTADLEIRKNGAGRLYYQALLTYSPKELKKDAINSGIEVRREYNVERNGKWELLNSPYKIKSGELIRVDLFISVPATRNFVVVADPIPGGLEPVNRDLATSSVVDANKGDFERSRFSFWFTHDDWISFGFMLTGFYHQELRHDSARFYSEYLGAGNYLLSYTAQAIAPGKYTILPLHAEEMYDPDVFGQGIPEELIVEAGVH